MSNDRTPILAALGAGFGAFLAAAIPSAWPWYLELLTAAAAGVVVYVAVRLYSRARGQGR